MELANLQACLGRAVLVSSLRSVKQQTQLNTAEGEGGAERAHLHVQDSEVGDGTTSVVIIAAELRLGSHGDPKFVSSAAGSRVESCQSLNIDLRLKRANELVKNNIHPTAPGKNKGYFIKGDRKAAQSTGVKSVSRSFGDRRRLTWRHVVSHCADDHRGLSPRHAGVHQVHPGESQSFRPSLCLEPLLLCRLQEHLSLKVDTLEQAHFPVPQVLQVLLGGHSLWQGAREARSFFKRCFCAGLCLGRTP